MQVLRHHDGLRRRLAGGESPAPRRILIRGTNWLGDAVITTPGLRRLREALPNARITLLTPAKLAPLWTGHPALDHVVSIPEGAGPWTVARHLRQERADTALILPNSHRSALECWWAGIPRRVGAALPWRNAWLTEAVHPPPDVAHLRKRSVREIRRRLAQDLPRQSYPAASHQLHHYLRLAQALGATPEPCAPRLSLSEEEIRDAVARVKAMIDTGADLPRPWFALNPGAEYGPAKRWPAERFAAAAAKVRLRTGGTWLILGGPSDRAVAAAIHQQLPGSQNLAGRTTLRDLLITLHTCRLLLSNDTGPLHVAAALGVPVVAPYGSTSPELTGPGIPGDTQHRLLTGQAPCAPCFRRTCPVDLRCLHDVTVDRVADAMLKLASGLTDLSRTSHQRNPG